MVKKVQDVKFLDSDTEDILVTFKIFSRAISLVDIHNARRKGFTREEISRALKILEKEELIKKLKKKDGKYNRYSLSNLGKEYIKDILMVI